MDNPFKNFFGKKPEEPKPEENTETLYPGFSASSKRLLGLKEFNKLTPEQEQELFKSDNRLDAYANVDTTTMPRSHKVEYKKGIIREIAANHLIPEEVLKNNVTVYLGSGTDVEYPLALGAHDIWLVDPMFQSAEAKRELKQRIEKIIKEKLPEEIQDQFDFNFDFGNGKENVKITLISKSYGSEPVDFPEQIGLVIKFASQGSTGEVVVGRDIEERMINGGYILDESKLGKRENGEIKVQQLGK